MSLSLTIRHGAPNDAEALCAFARQVFAAQFAADNDPADFEAYMDSAFTPALQQAELTTDGLQYLLLEVDGALAGYAMLRDAHGETCVVAQHPVELQRFYIDHAWHGHGLAPALMARVVEHAQQWGGDVLWLGVWEHNPRAIQFYRKQGFVDVGTHVFVVGTDPQTDRVMQRAIVSSPASFPGT